MNYTNNQASFAKTILANVPSDIASSCKLTLGSVLTLPPVSKNISSANIVSIISNYQNIVKILKYLFIKKSS